MSGKGSHEGSSSGDAGQRGRGSSASSAEADAPAARSATPVTSLVSERLREDVRRARRDAETGEILQVIAESSGLSLEQMCEHPETVTYVELFLLTLPRIPQLSLFPNMTSVKLMHIGLTSMQDLAELTQVEELWLSDNAIRRIEGLDRMTRLRRLYLQGNQITSLDGLPQLKHLRELWLCRNKIKHVDAVKHLYKVRKLRSLWLAGNPISHLQDAFRPFLSHLREVNLAGCEIFCFSQIAHLRALSGSLRKLWFSDPIFGENPICRLNNYATFTIQLLGSTLEQLDHEEVTDEQRALAATVYDKKRIYYSMRLHSLQRNHGLLCNHAYELAQDQIAQAEEATEQLDDCLAAVQGCVRERRTFNGKCSSAALSSVPLDSLEGLERDLSRAIGTREVQIQAITKRLSEAVTVSDHTRTLLQERLCVELHSGGNVRLDEVLAPTPASAGSSPSLESGSVAGTGKSSARPGGKRGGAVAPPTPQPPQQPSPASPEPSSPSPSPQQTSDGFYDSASELLQNGFAVAEDEFKSRFGITGVKVERVFRVVNRGQRVRFDDRIRSLEIDMSSTTNRRKMVCLFSPVAGDHEEQGAYLRHVLLNGMDVPSRKKSHGSAGSASAEGYAQPPPSSEGVPMTNSLFLADEARLLACLRNGELTGINANPNALVGQLVVSRVFLGKSVQALGGSKAAASTGAATEDARGGTSTSTAAAAAFISKSRRVLLKDYSEDVFSVYRTPASTVASDSAGSTSVNSSNIGGRVWYCLDRALVLPEFVVDYSYTLSSAPLGGVAPLLSATPALSLLSTRQTAAMLREKLSHRVLPSLAGGAGATSGASAAAATAWSDLRLSCHYLLAFVSWCQDGTVVSQFAKEETERVLTAARALLKEGGSGSPPNSAPTEEGQPGRKESDSVSAARLMSTSVPDGVAAPVPPSQPLTEATVAAYCRAVGSDSLTYCQLRGQSLTSVPKEFSSPAFSSLAQLDLSGNQLLHVSWFALAQGAPHLEVLLLQHNALTSLDLQGTRMPTLTTLNIAHNALSDSEEFAEVALCFPRLRSLRMEHNPVVAREVHGKHGEYAVLLHFIGSSSLESFNHVDLSALNKPSLTRWRYKRTLDVNNQPALLNELVALFANMCDEPTATTAAVAGGKGRSPTAQDTESVSSCGSAVEGSAVVRYEMTSLEPEVAPMRLFELALRNLTDDQTSGSHHRASRSRHLTGSLSTSGGTVASPTHDGVARPVTSFVYNHSLTRSIAFVAHHSQQLSSLRHLVLRGHSICDLSPVTALPLVELVDVEDNCVSELPDLSMLARLRTLNVSFNRLFSISAMGEPPALQCLNACANRLSSLDSALLSRLTELRELYLANNALTKLNEFYPLKDMPHLVTLDVSGNMLEATEQGGGGGGAVHRSSAAGSVASDTRTYFIYLFHQLKVLDGTPISQTELQRARDAFAGKMSSDLLAERVPGPSSRWPSLSELDLSHCALREVALLEPFAALEVLKLNHNVLTRLTGVAVLKNLRALDLAFNRLGSTAALAVGEALKPLANLESLSLEGNHISDLNALGLQLANLKFLNLKSNELQYLDRGLYRLPQLREVIVDQNKLRSLNPDCFSNCKWLTDVSADDNAIRTTDGLAKLRTLQRLSLAANRLGELQPLLADLQYSPVQELVLIGNPIARKSNYRANVIAGNPTLAVLDRKPISREERERAELTTRQSEQYVVPANVVIDMSFVNSLAMAQNGMAPGGAAAVLAAGGPNFPPSQQPQQSPPSMSLVTPSPPSSRVAGPRLQPLPNKRGGYYGRGSPAVTARRF